MDQKPKRIKRFVIYVPDEQHRQLRAKLALKGTTVADWFRKKAQEEIDSK